MEGKLITIEELSEYLRVKRSSIYQWVHARKIPYIKIGALLRFKKSEIEAWLETRKVSPEE